MDYSMIDGEPIPVEQYQNDNALVVPSAVPGVRA